MDVGHLLGNKHTHTPNHTRKNTSSAAWDLGLPTIHYPHTQELPDSWVYPLSTIHTHTRTAWQLGVLTTHATNHLITLICATVGVVCIITSL